MKKKLICLVALVAMLCALCAFACAENELQLVAPNGKGSAVTAVTRANDTVDVTPARGATVKLWYWNDGTGCYDMKTAKEVNRILYTVRGKTFSAEIVTGKDWLTLRHASDFGSFSWSMSKNTSTAARTGTIKVSDGYGVICYIEIRQCCAMDIVSVKQLEGEEHNGKVRIQSTRATGTHGKVYYWFNAYNDRYVPVKYTRGTIWFHQNRAPYQYHYYYLRPYRVIAGKNLQGPLTELHKLYLEH